MSEKLLGYCGVDCDVCQIRMASVNNDEVMKKNLAAFFSEKNNTVVLPEKINCTGCVKGSRENTALFGHCQNCPVRVCATAKKVDTCVDCQEYACLILKNVWNYLPVDLNAQMNLESLLKK